MKPKQSLGQNFLMHQRIADRIADAAKLDPGSNVLEIGPGTGMLTRSLLARAASVIAIEADSSLLPELEATFVEESTLGKLTLLSGDIRSFELTALPQPYSVVANIPYYITGEIIRKLLSASNKPESITLLVQKEVAARIARSKKESLLSLSVKVYGTPHYEFTVPRGAFRPAPNVDSAVLRISDIHAPFASVHEEERFFTLLHAGFAHKRKQLGKNLEVVASSEAISAAFEEVGIPEKARAEDIAIAEWRKLGELLKEG